MRGRSYTDSDPAAARAGDTGERKEQGIDQGAYVLPNSLIRVLSDPGVLLVGVGIGGDVGRLEREYEQLRGRVVKGSVDLSEMAKRKVRV